VASAALIGGVFCFVQRRKKQRQDRVHDEIPLSPAPGTMDRQSMYNSAEMQKHFEIPYNEIKIEKEIGRGAFGVVFKAQWRNCDCVVKQLNLQDADSKEEFLKEARNVMKLKLHQNVCGVFGVCTDPNHPTSIVMEFVEGGSLKELVYDDKTKLDALTVVRMAKDVAGGMSHIHEEGILHCDLACRNLLYSSRGNGRYLIKVTDLGLARISETGHYDAKADAKFPIRWSAPEVHMKHKLSKASDVWAFGVVLYEMMEGRLPYFKLKNSEVIEFICNGGLLEQPNRINCPELWNIALQCFQMEPSDRPTFHQLFTELSDLESKLSGANDPKSLQSDSDAFYGNNNANQPHYNALGSDNNNSASMNSASTNYTGSQTIYN